MDEIDFDANQTYEEFLEKHVADKSQKIYSHQDPLFLIYLLVGIFKSISEINT